MPVHTPVNVLPPISCISELRPFQRRFVREAYAPGIDTAALSLPRSNGKSWLAGFLLAKYMDPTDPLFADGDEVVLLAKTLEQARIVFRFVRARLEPVGGYRWTDSTQRIGCVHLASNTRLRVISSDGKGAMGLVGVRIAVADEPGAWSANSIMSDALETALGKPNSAMKIIYIGTLAPATGGFWHDMIEGGSSRSTYVMALQADPTRWDQWSEIKRVNPLTSISAPFRLKLLEERDKAREDSRLRARFLSYRLNLPSMDEADMLLTVGDWELMSERAVPERQGDPIVAIDLGSGRAWSAAVAMWEGGRCEALAVAPGLPSLEEQERRDRVPAGTYRALAAKGLLAVSEGLRVQPPAQLWEQVTARWGVPVSVICDRFRLAELEDAIGGRCGIEPRVSRWSEASADIRALRGLAKDGPLSVVEQDRDLLQASLSVAQVKNDDQGSTRLTKSSSNVARDDVAAALVLAAGAYRRAEGVGVSSGPGIVVVR